MVMQQSGSADSIRNAAVELSKLGDGSAALQQKLQDSLTNAAGKGLFDINAAVPDRGKKTGDLYAELAGIVAASAPPVSAASTVTPAVATAPVQPGNSTESLSSQIAVQLTRRAGNRIIVPLEMVRNYSPADIWLSDGDRVQVMPLAMTEAGQKTADLNPAAISTYDISEAPGVDLLVLTHNSVVDGKQEQYYVPATNPQYYGNAAFVAEWQQTVYVHNGDRLQAGTLELSPIIQKSRENLIAASAAAIEDRRNPVSAWKHKLHQKIERDKKAFGNLPGVSQIRQQIEQQVGPVSDPVNQTTGLNSEEFCRSLTP
jgi:hypothetical protein